MNETLISNWNEKVKGNDIVIFLGDFCMGNPELYLSQLNGQITFIKGNHDDSNSLSTEIQYLVLEHRGKEYFCIHNPIEYSSAYGVNLVAHIHNVWTIKKIYKNILVNVGVDCWSFSPITLDDISIMINKYLNNEKNNGGNVAL